MQFKLGIESKQILGGFRSKVATLSGLRPGLFESRPKFKLRLQGAKDKKLFLRVRVFTGDCLKFVIINLLLYRN